MQAWSVCDYDYDIDQLQKEKEKNICTMLSHDSSLASLHQPSSDDVHGELSSTLHLRVCINPLTCMVNCPPLLAVFDVSSWSFIVMGNCCTSRK
jgi:hypothetical protein